jgi:hypothetical protein
MRALETRADLARHPDVYFAPLPLTGAPAEAMDAWITAGVTPGTAGAFEQRGRPKDRGHEGLAAEGSEVERTCRAPLGEAAWRARVVGVRSPRPATHQAAGLEKRLRQAETTLAALTPARGRGKRHITEEAPRVEAIALVLTAHRVEGGLRVAGEKPVEQQTH